MNELALFAGAGGGILGGHLLGWRTICAVEINPYAASVLCARQNEGLLSPFPIWDDVCTFDGRPWRGRVDVVSGGFPCQDISVAGKGAGIGGQGLDSGQSSPESSGKWNRSGSLWKTLPPFVLGALEWSCARWPRWGTMRNGECFQRSALERITRGSGFGLWATPTARDWRSGKASQATMERNSRPLSEQIGGLLSPTWVEWLMGWPLGWTDLGALGTDKFQQWRQGHGLI